MGVKILVMIIQGQKFQPAPWGVNIICIDMALGCEHPRVMNNLPPKFHRNPSDSLGENALYRHIFRRTHTQTHTHTDRPSPIHPTFMGCNYPTRIRRDWSYKDTLKTCQCEKTCMGMELPLSSEVWAWNITCMGMEHLSDDIAISDLHCQPTVPFQSLLVEHNVLNTSNCYLCYWVAWEYVAVP